MYVCLHLRTIPLCSNVRCSSNTLECQNLAHTVTKHALQHMFYQARVAARSLKFGLPLTEVLGSELPPPHLSALAGVDTRGLLTGSRDSSDSDGQLVVLPSVSGPVPTMQRMYHTSARAEGKGKAKQKIYVLPAIHAVRRLWFFSIPVLKYFDVPAAAG